MRCAVEGCNPVFSLISLSEIASSRLASTSIRLNMRSITWIAGVAGGALSAFLMALLGQNMILCREIKWRCHSVCH